MNAFKSLQTLGIASLACLAFGSQSLDAAKKQEKKDNASHRGHASAPAHAKSSSHDGGRSHVASASSHRSSPHVTHQAKSSGGSASRQRVAGSSHHRTQNDVAVHRSHSGRSDVAVNRSHSGRGDVAVNRSHPKRNDVAVRSSHSNHDRNVARANVSRASESRSVHHNDGRNRTLASQQFDHRADSRDSRGTHDRAHHSTRYRNERYAHHGAWHGDREWYSDRDYNWHHHHRYFWNGAWVIGVYPPFGYDPVGYAYDSQPLYPVNSTVVSVQRVLAQVGYYDGPIDGIAGGGTRGAIADYQSDNGLPVSGLIDEELLSSLGLI